MKFGGSLLSSRGGIKRVARIVADYSEEHQLVVVVSAMGDVTDILLKAADDARGWDRTQIDHLVNQMKEMHFKALRGAGLAGNQGVYKKVEDLLERLRLALLGVSILGELTLRSRDLILSFGERLSAPIVAASLESIGLRTKVRTGGEAGIMTDDSYGEALPVERSTKRQVRRRLIPLISRGIVPVITGFIAQTESGEVTTLGRGGSDFSATILAANIGAHEVWIWTDVDGIMTADPRTVGDARVIGELSYAEAEEMAFFGAKNMHPLALEPAKLARIPIRIKNGFKPDLLGTMICSSQKKSASVVKSVALVGNVGLLTVSGETLAGRPGIAARIFGLLAGAGINILMISQSVSEAHISVVLRSSMLAKGARILSRGLVESKIRAKVDVEPDIAVLAAVGAGMKGTLGVAAKVFTAMSKAGVNVRMIAQGSSELNISFVVGFRDATRAIRALHSALVLSSK